MVHLESSGESLNSVAGCFLENVDLRVIYCEKGAGVVNGP